MNTDPFEQRLQNRPLRQAPEAWRDPILAAAQAEARPRADRNPIGSWLQLVREWLWPHPAAWGALASCWVAVLILQRATAPSAAEIAQARADARIAAVFSTLLSDPAAMAILGEPGANPRPVRVEPRSPDLGRRRTMFLSTCAAYEV